LVQWLIALFDGSICTWKGEKLNIEVKGGARPYHARAFPPFLGQDLCACSS